MTIRTRWVSESFGRDRQPTCSIDLCRVGIESACIGLPQCAWPGSRLCRGRERGMNMQRCADVHVGYSQISIPSWDSYPGESGQRFFFLHALPLDCFASQSTMELGIEVDASEDPRVQGGVGRAGIRRPTPCPGRCSFLDRHRAMSIDRNRTLARGSHHARAAAAASSFGCLPDSYTSTTTRPLAKMSPLHDQTDIPTGVIVEFHRRPSFVMPR